MDEQRIIEQYHNLVVKIIWRYAWKTSIPLEDLIHEGYIGLIVAYRRFDPTRGVKFITYATWWIMQKIKLALHKDRGPYDDLVFNEEIKIDDLIYHTPYDEVHKKVLIDRLKGCMSILDDKEREVIQYRYLANSNKKMSFRAIGERIGLTGQRCEQIDKVALKKLRKMING